MARFEELKAEGGEKVIDAIQERCSARAKNSCDSNSDSELHEGMIAAYESFREVEKNENFKMLIIGAIEKNKPQLLKKLLSHRVDLNIEVTVGYRKTIPIRWAIKNGHTDLVRSLLSLSRDKNKDYMGEDYISSAISEYSLCLNCPEMLDVFIEQGVSLPQEMFSNAIARNAPLVVLEKLLSTGLKVDGVDSYGRTPLHAAKTAEAVNYLIRQNVDPNIKNSIERTPLHLAWHLDVLEALISAGADVNTKDKNGQTPMHSVKSEEGYALLKRNGADVNATDNSGDTPLHVFCDRGDPSTIKHLIKLGADIKLTNKAGRTPMDILLAAGRVNTDALKILLKAGEPYSDKIGRYLGGVKIIASLFNEALKDNDIESLKNLLKLEVHLSSSERELLIPQAEAAIANATIKSPLDLHTLKKALQDLRAENSPDRDSLKPDVKTSAQRGPL